MTYTGDLKVDEWILFKGIMTSNQSVPLHMQVAKHGSTSTI